MKKNFRNTTLKYLEKVKRTTVSEISDVVGISKRNMSSVLQYLKKEGCVRLDKIKEGEATWVFVNPRAKTKKETNAELDNVAVKQKILETLDGQVLTLKNISDITGIPFYKLKIAAGELNKARKISVHKKVKNLSYWTLGESELERELREKEERAKFACDHFREITQKAFLKKSYR